MLRNGEAHGDGKPQTFLRTGFYMESLTGLCSGQQNSHLLGQMSAEEEGGVGVGVAVNSRPPTGMHPTGPQ